MQLHAKGSIVRYIGLIDSYIEEHFDQFGQHHRDPSEGPAILENGGHDGGLLGEYYLVRGLLHREDGPALIQYNVVDGKPPQRELWYQNGYLHREPAEGPAHIEYSRKDYIPARGRYFLFGRPYRDPAVGPWKVKWAKSGREIACKTCPVGTGRPTGPHPDTLRNTTPWEHFGPG